MPLEMMALTPRSLAFAEKWMAMQSLDNQILIFGCDSFKQNVRPLSLPSQVAY